ncbi:zinc-binding dehydrogenase [Bradyrhizobium sp. NP1]|uniref:zinc-binding dehydrogenase n=1 Tax=Bradyrhizobium sp. NP1 TaxID=3049772 RepID=UPI0025A64EA1|nr:zinc-binding dehydrogenase [Bradyrhizobium sp. NP1]WJR80048.1 zinc-binding dehydrogenase [Bradyrhizobium sp. NP1]
MRAIVIKQYGGPEVLTLEERPDPEPRSGHVIVEVKAFGLNRAETYMRAGAWGDVAEITGIECVGTIRSDPEGRFMPGQKVAALMGGMGRLINGSYAEQVSVPATNVVPVVTGLAWEEFAAISESYATAWSSVRGNLGLLPGQTLVVRGATSALGQAAINIAVDLGVRVIATTRSAARRPMLEALGASEVLIEAGELSKRVRELYPKGVDAVLDVVGNSTVLDSLAMARRGGRACIVGLLDHVASIPNFNPMFQMPHAGVHFSSFVSWSLGTPDCPLTEIPFQGIVDRVAGGLYKAKPTRVFGFEDIREAHRLMEANAANGKIVVRL